MRKILPVTFILALFACGPESSPEGRSIIRDNQIKAEIGLLKEQNKAMLDSIVLIREELRTRKGR